MLDAIRRHAQPLARIGCVSLGTVYIIVGGLALLALTGVLTGSADEDRMVHVLVGLPGGRALVWGLIAGLVAYVLWRAVEVAADPYEFGRDARGLAVRFGVAMTGAGYGFIAWSAAQSALGSGGRGDASEEEQQRLVAQVLEWPAGAWILGGVGAILLLVAVLQFFLVATDACLNEVHMDGCSRRLQRLIRVLAWYGYSARGVILGVLGYFLLRGAIRRDPDAVGDTDTAFDFIGGGLAGDAAFFIVAVGTMAYGVFLYMNARYYRFERDPSGRRHVRFRRRLPQQIGGAAKAVGLQEPGAPEAVKPA